MVSSRQLDRSCRFWKRMEKGFLCCSCGSGGHRQGGHWAMGLDLTRGLRGGHCRVGGGVKKRGNRERGMVGGGPFLFYILWAQSLPPETSLLTLFLSPHPLLYLSLYVCTVACLITHVDPNFRVRAVGAGATHLLYYYFPPFLSTLPHHVVNPPFRQAGDTVLSAPLWQRHISPYQSSICPLYTYVLPCVCVCVCAGGGLASGRFPVNTDLCDGSVNDFIIWDKARVEQGVSEDLWGLGEEVMLGAGSLRPQTQAYKTQTGSSLLIKWADM